MAVEEFSIWVKKVGKIWRSLIEVEQERKNFNQDDILMPMSKACQRLCENLLQEQQQF